MLQAKPKNLSLFPEYRARVPQNTTLYKVVAENYKTFVFNCEETEKNLPKYVVDEFESFLKCGVLAYGFLRQKCEDCKFERVVAFSCKKRGFCSSCGGRRMAECAAHLVDEVFPKVGVRQWVLSFPMVLRFVLAKRPDFQSSCLKIVQRCIASYFQARAKRRGIGKIQTGAVTLIQRFGGSINLNTHFHMLVLEGGYYATDDSLKFFWSEPPKDEDIQKIVQVVSRRIVRFFTKRGYFSSYQEFKNDLGADGELLPYLQSASIASKIAMGERQGQRGRSFGKVLTGSFPEVTGPLCAQIDGFSLHAGVYCRPWERDKLEKLCRYVARPAVAEERLSVLGNGNIVYKLKKPYWDGTSHLLFCSRR